MSALHKVPKLKGAEDYKAWEVSIRSTLLLSGLFKVVKTGATPGYALSAGGPAPVGNLSATVLPNTSPTEYAFPTSWAGRIYVGPNTNPMGSKFEGSLTGPPDIDVSYVDGYSVPITCSSEGTAVSGCNIDLSKQPGITCNSQVDGPVCLNPAQNIADAPAPPFSKLV